MKQIWEMGSEFDWSNDFLVPSKVEKVLPTSYELFSTATSALLAINTLVSQNQGKRLRLHMPCFYCMKIAARLQTVYDVQWYRDLPNQSSPDFNSLNPLPGDLVLAANIFGIRPETAWREWLLQQRDITLIEDHSHDPFSLWAKQSTAHYAVASLRKTLPIPDGGMIWSPQGLVLPKASLPESPGAYQRLTAMLLKQVYLRGVKIPKDVYRQLDLESQEKLFHESDSATSTFTASVLEFLNIPEFRRQRESNVKRFVNLSQAEPHPAWTPLFVSWNSGSVPFNSILVCQNQEIRDALHQHLIDHNIFASIHWPQPKMGISSGDPMAIELANRILTIPMDQRYSLDDVERVMTIMTQFSISTAVSNRLKTMENILV